VRALFICSRNRLRSPTAEQVFQSWPNVEAQSAGLADDAEEPLSEEHVEWAEIIFVMEKIHRRRLMDRFGKLTKGKRIVVLDIPDEYGFMDEELVRLLEQKAGSFLR
jgi:predicted protein tyrosine phosphatase